MLKQDRQLNDEFSWRVHDGLNDWTARVDVKASIALAIEAVVVGFVVTLGTGDGPLVDLASWGEWSLRLGIGCLAVGVVLAILVVLPQLRARASKREYKTNLIYFGHLRHWKPEDLEKRLESDPRSQGQLARQLVLMSRVLWRKHVWLQWSLFLFLAGVLLVGLTFCAVPGTADHASPQGAVTPSIVDGAEGR